MTGELAPAAKERELSGKWVVVGMGLFGLLITGTVWTYWKLHLSPFLPLQRALAEAYPGCRPVVEGGQRKMHRETPKILRITMKVEFDPARDAARTDALFEEVVSLAEKTLSLDAFEIVELNVYQPVQETRLTPPGATRTKTLNPKAP